MTSSDLVRIRLLGGFRIEVGDRQLDEPVWRLRKARSLVKLLALAPEHRLHRDHVLDTLWPDLDSVAASNNLYQALHVARRALAAALPDVEFLRLRDDQLALASASSVWTDVDAFEKTAADASRTKAPAAYEAALALYTGDLLPEDRYDDWAAERRQSLETLRRRLLSELAHVYEDLGELASAITALRQLVATDPSDEDACVRLMRLLVATGRRQEAVHQYQQLRNALRRELDVDPTPATDQLYENILRQSAADAEQVKRANIPTSVPKPGWRFEQRISFLEVEGARIAYASVGHGPPLVFAPGWVSHLEWMWQFAPFRRFIEALAEHHTVIRYDRFGTGLSDRQRLDASFDGDVRVLEALVETLGLRRFDLFGACNTSHLAALYASRHPERIARMVLYGTWANGFSLASPAVQASLLGLIRAHWGLGSQTMADMFVAGEDTPTRNWFGVAQRLAASPDMAADLLAAIYASDARSILQGLRVPTLVLHRREDRAVPFRHGCEVAALVPGASLVALDGMAHLPYCGHPQPLLDAIRDFLPAEQLAGTSRVAYTNLHESVSSG